MGNDALFFPKFNKTAKISQKEKGYMRPWTSPMCMFQVLHATLRLNVSTFALNAAAG
jgi:hypothetical protein